jgi:hypothetical protein
VTPRLLVELARLARIEAYAVDGRDSWPPCIATPKPPEERDRLMTISDELEERARLALAARVGGEECDPCADWSYCDEPPLELCDERKTIQ